MDNNENMSEDLISEMTKANEKVQKIQQAMKMQRENLMAKINGKEIMANEQQEHTK